MYIVHFKFCMSLKTFDVNLKQDLFFFLLNFDPQHFIALAAQV